MTGRPMTKGEAKLALAEGTAVSLLKHIHADMTELMTNQSLHMETRSIAQATARNIETWSATSGLIEPHPETFSPMKVSAFGTPGKS